MVKVKPIKVKSKKSKKETAVRTQSKPLTPAVKVSNSNPSVDLTRRAQGLEKVCSLSDPFCVVAKGAKWPDGNGASSMVGQVRGHITVNSDAAGAALVHVTPALNYTFISGTLVAGTWTTSATLFATPGIAAITTYLNEYRLVTAGIVIRNVPAALVAQGFVQVTRMGRFPGVSTTIGAGESYGVSTSTHPITTGMEIPVIFRPLGNEARNFLAPNTSNTVIPNYWDTIKIELIGGPASNAYCLDIEVIYNLEFTLNSSYVTLQSYAPVHAPNNLALTQVSNQTSAKMMSTSHTSVSSFTSQTLKYAANLAATSSNPYVKIPGLLASALME